MKDKDWGCCPVFNSPKCKHRATRHPIKGGYRELASVVNFYKGSKKWN